MIARLIIRRVNSLPLNEIETEFSFDDANTAASDIGLTIMETIMPVMREWAASEAGTPMPAFDLTIDTREKW